MAAIARLAALQALKGYRSQATELFQQQTRKMSASLLLVPYSPFSAAMLQCMMMMQHMSASLLVPYCSFSDACCNA